MGIIRTNLDTTTNKDAFKTLVKSWWDCTDRPALFEAPNVVQMLTSKDEYERLGRRALLDYAGEVVEGAPIPIQSIPALQVKDYAQVSYGTGFRITDRMKRFEKLNLFEDATGNLKVMMKETKDVVIARMFNNMTSTTYASGFDGLAIAHNSHTCRDEAGTTYNNYLDQGFSLASLESAMNYFDYLYDDQGNIWTVTPDTLVVNRTLNFDAQEVLGSTLKPWESSNTDNVLKGILKPFVYHRLTSTTSWFVAAKNHPKYGYFVYTSMEPDVDVRTGFDSTRDTVVDSLQYFKPGVSDPRLLYVGDC